MKKMFTLAAMFAAFALVSCAEQVKKENAEEVATEAADEAVAEEVAPEAAPAAEEAPATEEVAE